MDEIDIKEVMYDGVRKLGNGLILLSLLPDLYFSVYKAFFSLFYLSNYEIQLFLHFIENIGKTITNNSWAYPNQCCLAGGTKCSLGGASTSTNLLEIYLKFHSQTLFPVGKFELKMIAWRFLIRVSTQLTYRKK